jgi:hypothetical protein
VFLSIRPVTYFTKAAEEKNSENLLVIKGDAENEYLRVIVKIGARSKSGGVSWAFCKAGKG